MGSAKYHATPKSVMPRMCFTRIIHPPDRGKPTSTPLKVPIRRDGSPGPIAKTNISEKPRLRLVSFEYTGFDAADAIQPSMPTRTGPTHGDATIPVTIPTTKAPPNPLPPIRFNRL